MVEIQIKYEGDLHCTARHAPSGATITTDAPRDNKGKGEVFSPTDLVAAALGTCILTIMGIQARRMDVDLRGSTVIVTKEMTPNVERRIARLGVTVSVPVILTAEQKQKLEHAAYTCPVHKSLHPDIQMPITFNWA
ncbi:MAG: OsmC family protein [Tepidisphaeraceae bacterium]|jgi:putative redox protein